MARKGRINLPGAVYHVILRGNDRRDIFTDDKDRFRLYTILNRSFERFNFRIHAFCLISNHFHLEIQVGDISLPKLMQSIAQRHTQWFNWRHQKSGHLFQSRYKAILVDADEYLLELAAYLHLNPIRAKLTDRPSLFRIFVNDRIGEERSKEFHGEKNLDNRIFGDDSFVLGILQEPEETESVFDKPYLKGVLEYGQSLKILWKHVESAQTSGAISGRAGDLPHLILWDGNFFENKPICARIVPGSFCLATLRQILLQLNLIFTLHVVSTTPATPQRKLQV